MVPIAVLLAAGPSRTGLADTTGAAAPDPHTSNPVEEARGRFRRGVKFYNDGDYRSALVEFQEAYRISPNFKVQYNIGQTFEELQDFAGAVSAFQAYLDAGAGELTKARREVVAAELKQLEGHVAHLEVESVESGADVVAEGERRVVLGTTPLSGAVLLNSGTWDVTARKEGFEPHTERIIVSGGDHKKLVLDLKRPAPEAPLIVRTEPLSAPPPPPPAPAPAPRRSMTPVWIGIGATGALAVGATVTGVLALNAKSDYDSKLATFGVSSGDISQASSRAKTLALASDVFTGGAVAGAVVTTILLLTGGPAKKPATSGIDLLVGPGEIGARGAF
jgi:hypothetical protein